MVFVVQNNVLHCIQPKDVIDKNALTYHRFGQENPSYHPLVGDLNWNLFTP